MLNNVNDFAWPVQKTAIGQDMLHRLHDFKAWRINIISSLTICSILGAGLNCLISLIFKPRLCISYRLSPGSPGWQQLAYAYWSYIYSAG